MDKRPLLQANNISKAFHHPTLVQLFDSISLELFPQESIAIMGKSGEGKSTLLHILGTLEAPSAGELYIKDQLVNAHNSPKMRNCHIGFVFQSFNLLDDYTVLENVLMPANIAGHKKEKKEKGMQLLEQVGLAHRAQFATKLLSGGEKQRVAIARALCNDPDIILADEPSGNLDQATSSHIHELLINCAKRMKKGVIIVTHNLELASLCDRTLQLSNKTLF